MCGIAGMAGDGANEPSVKAMCDRLSHRGPDDEGFFIDSGIAIGNRRLSIVDVPGGNQPVHNENEDIHVVYNGEIYNYKEIMNDLISNGHKFYTSSDTEVIVHAYEQYGHDCIKRFCGMFAFALWDSRKKELFLARDPIGIKPLYYHFDGETLRFASEIKAIIEDENVPRQIDTDSMSDYLSFRFVPAPKTMFRGIMKLPAAHYMLFRNGNINIEKYWDAEFTSSKKTPGEFRGLFMDIVASHMMGEVPVGAFLSGGLDSSAIVAAMKTVKEDIKTFSVGFDLPGYNEFEYSDMVAAKFSTDHKKLTLDFSSFDALPSVAWHFDEPVADPAAVPLYHLSRMAKKSVTVLLSGEGSDELFGGYTSASLNATLMKISRLKGNALGALLAPIGYAFPDIPYIGNVVKSVALPYADFFSEISSTYKKNDRASLLQGPPRSTHGSNPLNGYLNAKRTTELNRMLYVSLKLLQDGLMMKADKMTMAASIESRVPFLDKRIVEFSASLPDAMKRGKYVVKESMKGFLPTAVIYRKKTGFPVPIDAILKEKEGTVKDLILNGAMSKYFRRDALERVVASHFNGGKKRGSQIYTLLMLELWNKIYVEKTATGKSSIDDLC